MSYCDLLERMMQKDTDAFLEMTDNYGWALYSEIRKKIPKKADADRIYDETMQQFYRCLQNSACDDPMEALLYAFADKISKEQGLRGDCLTTYDVNIQPPVLQIPYIHEADEGKRKKKKGHGWLRLGLALLMISFLAVLWTGLGLMMEAGLIPYVDLGYTWFSSFAGRWI